LGVTELGGGKKGEKKYKLNRFGGNVKRHLDTKKKRGGWGKKWEKGRIPTQKRGGYLVLSDTGGREKQRMTVIRPG